LLAAFLAFEMTKFFSVFLIAFILRAASAREPAPEATATASDLESLRQQVQSLTETVKALQQQVTDQQTLLEKANITGSETVEPPSLPGAATLPSAGASAPPLFPTEDASVVAGAPSTSQPAVNANGTAAAGAFPTTDESVVASSASTGASTLAAPGGSLTQPITIAGGGKNYMNISLDGLFAGAFSTERDFERLQPHGHDPSQRGFTVQNVELTFQGAVDPYFEAFSALIFLLDPNAETEVELEEAWLQTTSLPFGLQFKGGQFLSPFGRINQIHPHAFDFADAPLILGRLLGPDGLRGAGGQLSWLIPVPWYSQLTLALQNGRGGTAYAFRNPGEDGIFFGRMTTDRELRGLYDFVWIPRFENSFNLSDTQTVLFGASGAFGSNDTGANTRTQIYGGDFLYKWKSSRAEGGFPFVKWQTEFMYRRFEAGHGVDQSFPVAETFHDWGMYSQLLWGFKKGWVAGLRGDYLHMTDSASTDDLTREPRSRVSANLTWYPTEFSKIRLQYNHDFLEGTQFFSGEDADSVFLQIEFILGAHGAHKF
jgi:hypothetical protein